MNPTEFDPNAPGSEGLLFGLPYSPEGAMLLILPVPWDVTTSYHPGTCKGPLAILKASSQVDLAVLGIEKAWEYPVAFAEYPEEILEQSVRLRFLSERYMEHWPDGDPEDLNEINQGCEEMTRWVNQKASEALRLGKVVGTLGGDHSTPLGLLQALAGKHDDFGILQIDAHADLRESYENFTYSHASIMYNALKLDSITHLVQVGIRDICEEEINRAEEDNRITLFANERIREEIFRGGTWDRICDRIVQKLPQLVYISLDVDGLTPSLCPNTGTPVPGGLSFEETQYLIRKVVEAGKQIIGFDLSEVSPGDAGDWDANVGARLLYLLSVWTGVSQGDLKQN